MPDVVPTDSILALFADPQWVGDDGPRANVICAMAQELQRLRKAQRPAPTLPEGHAVISVEWFARGDLLPSGDKSEGPMTLIGVHGHINGVGAGDRVVYQFAARARDGSGEGVA